MTFQQTINLTLACLTISLLSPFANAQSIPVDETARGRYSSASRAEKERIDRLYHLMLLGAGRQLEAALKKGTDLSRARYGDVKRYREEFRAHWYARNWTGGLGMLPPPENPEDLPASDKWSYRAFVEESMTTKLWERRILSYDLGSDVLELAGSLGPGGLYTKAALAIGGKFFDQKASASLLDQRTASEMFEVAVASVVQSRDDAELQAAVASLLSRDFGDQFTILDIFEKKLESRVGQTEKELGRAVQSEAEARELILQVITESKEQLARQAHDRISAEKAEKFAWRIAEAEGLVSLIANLLMLRDPEAARRVSTYGNAGVRLAELGGLYAMGKLGPLAYAGGVASVFGAIATSEITSQENAQVGQQLREIALAIADLKEVMLTGFKSIDEKITVLLNFNVVAAHDTSVALRELRTISEDLSDNVAKLSGAVENGKIEKAIDRYRAARRDVAADIVESCALLRPGNDGFECLRQVFITLLIKSRVVQGLASDAVQESGGAIHLHPNVFRSLDLLISAELGSLIPGQEAALIKIGDRPERIPAGVPDLAVWLTALAELRKVIEINKVPLSAGDVDALRAVAADGAKLAAAADILGSEVLSSSWVNYLEALKKLDDYARQALEGRRFFMTESGLPYDLRRFCLGCAYEEDARNAQVTLSPSDQLDPRLVAARVEALRPPERTKPWAQRVQLYDMFDRLFASQIGPDVAHIEVAAKIEGSILVSASSLPESFWTAQEIGEFRQLSRFGAIRLYARIRHPMNGGYAPSPERWRTVECGLVQPGAKCIAARLSGVIELVANFSPSATVEQFVQESRARGFDYSIAAIQEQVNEAFPTHGSFVIASQLIGFDAMYPVTPVGGTLVVEQPDEAQWLAYLFDFLAKASPTIERTSEYQRLDLALKEAKRIKSALGQDIHRAILSSAERGSAISVRVVLRTDEVTTIGAAARNAHIALRRWLILMTHTPVSDGWLIEQNHQLCRINSEAMFDLDKDRDLLFLENEAPIITASARSRYCGGGPQGQVQPRRLALYEEVRDRTEWLKKLVFCQENLCPK